MKVEDSSARSTLTRRTFVARALMTAGALVSLPEAIARLRLEDDATAAPDLVVVAEVDDDGPGVIESKLAEKSERAFPTEIIRKGILDLMVLKKVVEFYGGIIRIINRKDGGVKVTIMFKAQLKE